MRTDTQPHKNRAENNSRIKQVKSIFKDDINICHQTIKTVADVSYMGGDV